MPRDNKYLDVLRRLYKMGLPLYFIKYIYYFCFWYNYEGIIRWQKMYCISEIHIFYRKNKEHETILILNLPLRKYNYFTVAKFITDDKYNQIIFFSREKTLL